jgi:hypothetical protein
VKSPLELPHARRNIILVEDLIQGFMCVSWREALARGALRHPPSDIVEVSVAFGVFVDCIEERNGRFWSCRSGIGIDVCLIVSCRIVWSVWI